MFYKWPFSKLFISSQPYGSGLRLLLPKYRRTSRKKHNTHDVLVNDHNLLGFDEIGAISILIDSSAIKSSSASLFRSSADEVVGNFYLINICLEFIVKSLDYRDAPLVQIFILEQVIEEDFIPKVPTDGFASCLRVLDLAALSEIGIKGKIEAKLKYLFLESFKNIFLFLVYFRFEGNKINGGDLIYALPLGRKRGLLVHIVSKHQEANILNPKNAQNQATVTNLRFSVEDEQLALFYHHNAYDYFKIQ